MSAFVDARIRRPAENPGRNPIPPTSGSARPERFDLDSRNALRAGCDGWAVSAVCDPGVSQACPGRKVSVSVASATILDKDAQTWATVWMELQIRGEGAEHPQEHLVSRRRGPRARRCTITLASCECHRSEQTRRRVVDVARPRVSALRHRRRTPWIESPAVDTPHHRSRLLGTPSSYRGSYRVTA